MKLHTMGGSFISQNTNQPVSSALFVYFDDSIVFDLFEGPEILLRVAFENMCDTFFFVGLIN